MVTRATPGAPPAPPLYFGRPADLGWPGVDKMLVLWPADAGCYCMAQAGWPAADGAPADGAIAAPDAEPAASDHDDYELEQLPWVERAVTWLSRYGSPTVWHEGEFRRIVDSPWWRRPLELILPLPPPTRLEHLRCAQALALAMEEKVGPVEVTFGDRRVRAHASLDHPLLWVGWSAGVSLDEHDFLDFVAQGPMGHTELTWQRLAPWRLPGLWRSPPPSP
ncbi:MAG TPA: hypothetical protein VGQ83_23775 [Polyangia bacterium]|jgi:hypothetical protein